jgi:hypothetical protein
MPHFPSKSVFSPQSHHMKKPLLLYTLLLGLSSLLSAQTWYKGNLHTHSLWSDGDDYPEMIMAWYKAAGYHFVGLSDHNTLQEGEQWRWIPRAPERRHAFERYLHTYGPQWVVYEKRGKDSLRVRLKTLREYVPLFAEKGRFLILPSEEISASYAGKPLHLNATNIRGFVPVQRGNSVSEVLQSNIDAVLAQRRISGQPMFPHINHPNFHFAISTEDMQALKHERFLRCSTAIPMCSIMVIAPTLVWRKCGIASICTTPKLASPYSTASPPTIATTTSFLGRNIAIPGAVG